MTGSRSIVLLSAGLDSTTNLLEAVERTTVEMALTFDYGQAAAAQELHHSGEIARRYGIPHRIVPLPWLSGISDSALFSGDVPTPGKDQLIGPDAYETAKAVWVPNRNGVFINIAAAFAEALDCSSVITGFNAEEAATFPDNSRPFVESANKALAFSTSNHVECISFTQEMDKIRIAAMAEEMGIPWELVWACYLGGELMCGRCESCVRLKAAMAKNGLEERLDGRFLSH